MTAQYVWAEALVFLEKVVWLNVYAGVHLHTQERTSAYLTATAFLSLLQSQGWIHKVVGGKSGNLLFDSVQPWTPRAPQDKPQI